jgi:hypothetical protein
MRSFRKATCWMSGGSLREHWRVKICWVSRSLNDLITEQSYNAERYTSSAMEGMERMLLWLGWSKTATKAPREARAVNELLHADVRPSQ